MTKVTSGGITIENGNIQTGQGATATDLQGAFQKYTEALVMDGGLSQEDLDDIYKVTGQFGQIFSTLPVTTTQASATPSASTTPAPAASDNLKPRNDGTLFNSLNDGHMASILQAKFTKSNDGKWTQEEINNSEKFLKEQGITNPPTQEQKDKLKTTLGVTQPSATSSAAPSATPSATPAAAPSTTPAPKETTAPAPKETTAPAPKETTAPKPYSAKNDPVLKTFLEDGNTAIGSVYGSLAAEERQFFDEKLSQTKSQEEAFELINKLKQFASSKDGNRGYNGSIDGFHSQRDSRGSHLVDAGSEAERFMKDVLGVTPSYWG